MSRSAISSLCNYPTLEDDLRSACATIVSKRKEEQKKRKREVDTWLPKLVQDTVAYSGYFAVNCEEAVFEPMEKDVLKLIKPVNIRTHLKSKIAEPSVVTPKNTCEPFNILQRFGSLIATAASKETPRKRALPDAEETHKVCTCTCSVLETTSCSNES